MQRPMHLPGGGARVDLMGCGAHRIPKRLGSAQWLTKKGSTQIAVEIQHKDTFLADKSAIKHVLAAQGCPIRSD